MRETRDETKKNVKISDEIVIIDCTIFYYYFSFQIKFTRNLGQLTRGRTDSNIFCQTNFESLKQKKKNH